MLQNHGRTDIIFFNEKSTMQNKKWPNSVSMKDAESPLVLIEVFKALVHDSIQ